MRNILVIGATLLLTLTGCTAAPVAETSQAPDTASADASIDSIPPIVSAWLAGSEVSAQLILDDLTYGGFCNEWGEAPSPDSEYGQAYKRDYVRDCTSGRTKYSAPDCSAYLQIGTMDQAVRLPVDMSDVYEGAHLAIFSNPKFSIGLTASMSENSYETDLQRCWGTIVALGEFLGESVETQIYGDYAITSGLNMKPLDSAFGDNPDEWFPLSDEVYAKWEGGEGYSCPTWMEYGCAIVSLQTLGWCESLTINYDLLDKNEKLLESKVATMASEGSYMPFIAYLDAEANSKLADQTKLQGAECSSWIR